MDFPFPKNMCRMCGQPQDLYYSIFDFVYPNDVKLVDKILKCIPLNMHENDQKPQQVCVNCFESVNQFYSFIEMCFISDINFERTLSNISNIQPEGQTSVIVSLKPIEIEPAAKEEHIETVPIQPESSKRTERSSKKIKVHSNIEISPKKVESKPESKPLKTKKNETLISVQDIINQVQKNKTPSKVPEVQNNPQETTKSVFKCKYCNKQFSRSVNLVSHLSTHTKNKPFNCLDCSAKFSVKSQLTQHKKIHNGEFKCRVCSKRFIVPSKLKRHMTIHSKEKSFVCELGECGKRFGDQSNFKEHQKIHLNEYQEKCTICGKLFKTKSLLKNHKFSHTKNYIHKCTICDNVYKYKNNLVIHMKKHNGYICPFCSEDCQTLTKLSTHKRTCSLAVR